jgi:hypothetical protein
MPAALNTFPAARARSASIPQLAPEAPEASAEARRPLGVVMAPAPPLPSYRALPRAPIGRAQPAGGGYRPPQAGMLACVSRRLAAGGIARLMAPTYGQDYRTVARSAIRAFDRAIAVAPGSSRHPETLSALALRGLGHRLLGHDAALADFHVVLQQNPVHRAALTHGIMQLLAAPNFETNAIAQQRAELWLALALARYPNDAYTRLAEALIAERIGDMGLCITRLQALVESQPTYLTARLALASAYLVLHKETGDTGCADAALDACRGALALGHNTEMAWSIVEHVLGWHVDVNGHMPLYEAVVATYGADLGRPRDCLKLPLVVQDPALAEEVHDFWHRSLPPTPSTANLVTNAQPLPRPNFSWPQQRHLS